MFQATLNQMAVLALYIVIGFILAKVKAVPDNSTKVLSKLENNVFIPALVLGTFIQNFTVDTLSATWKLLLFSLVLVVISIPLAILISKLVTKDGYIQKIYTYGLTFSNFGFMGNAIVSALFPDYFMYYVIFTLPLWTVIYVWGVPFLLMDRKDEDKKGVLPLLKNLINPMFIALIVGVIIGLTGLNLPSFISEVVSACSSCMSPVAMILTGMTFSTLNFKKVLSNVGVYIVSVVRLIVLPCAFVGLYYLVCYMFSISFEQYFFVCLLCASAMPLGLNTIVIPSAYGKDTSIAAGMTLVSHVLSIGTIPLMVLLFL